MAQRFLVQVEGENFHIPLTNGAHAQGFYTTRWVDAQDEIEARYLAFESINLELCQKMNVAEPPKGQLTVHHVQVAPPGADEMGQGFSFYGVLKEPSWWDKVRMFVFGDKVEQVDIAPAPTQEAPR